MLKKRPRPRPLSGSGLGKGPAARVFRGPVRPVTNSRTNTEESNRAAGDLRFDPRDNRCTHSDKEWPRHEEDPNSDGHQPDGSAAAAK